QNLKAVVLLNKIDKPAATPHEVLDQLLHLFIQFQANHDQLHFPLLYPSPLNPTPTLHSQNQHQNIQSLYHTIIDYLPPPLHNSDQPLQFQI
ncbi:P-loop NTPase family protein, partial [Staphylococcus epidermidis]